MKVLVDTDIWSEALHKKKGKKSFYVDELVDLIQEGRLEIIGPIRMEILSGIRDGRTFDAFSKSLSAFVDRIVPSEAYILAAKFLNLCRGKGIQGSNTDFVICACSVHWSIPILSKDKDYLSYRKHLPIELIEPRKKG
ncbi:MAG: PIN domain nuclease [Verrucomicrobiota bacterium]